MILIVKSSDRPSRCDPHTLIPAAQGLIQLPEKQNLLSPSTLINGLTIITVVTTAKLKITF
jgi:hypothetical protein